MQDFFPQNSKIFFLCGGVGGVEIFPFIFQAIHFFQVALEFSKAIKGFIFTFHVIVIPFISQSEFLQLKIFVVRQEYIFSPHLHVQNSNEVEGPVLNVKI